MESRKVGSVIIGVILFLCLASCATIFAKNTPPFQTWEGAAVDATRQVTFSYEGTGAYGLLLYAVDGQPRTRMGDIGNRRLLEGSYSNTLMCGFNVLLLPGNHSFEFYTVDTNPLQIFTIQFPVSAGKSYTLEGSSKSFTVTADGAQVPFARKDVPALIEPPETAPHATLVFSRKGGAMDVNAWIFRIDDMIRAPMFKRHPRWVVMNYSGLASGVINSIGGSGMLIQGNAEAAEGTLSVRLTPGSHRIEGFAETMFLGSRILGDTVRIFDFNFEAGKTYRIILVPDTVKNEISGVFDNGIAIVPE